MDAGGAAVTSIELLPGRRYGGATMSLLDSLERRFGRFALPGLIRIVVALTALVYLLTFLNPEFSLRFDA